MIFDRTRSRYDDEGNIRGVGNPDDSINEAIEIAHGLTRREQRGFEPADSVPIPSGAGLESDPRLTDGFGDGSGRTVNPDDASLLPLQMRPGLGQYVTNNTSIGKTPSQRGLGIFGENSAEKGRYLAGALDNISQRYIQGQARIAEIEAAPFINLKGMVTGAAKDGLGNQQLGKQTLGESLISKTRESDKQVAAQLEKINKLYVEKHKQLESDYEKLKSKRLKGVK